MSSTNKKTREAFRVDFVNAKKK